MNTLFIISAVVIATQFLLVFFIRRILNQGNKSNRSGLFRFSDGKSIRSIDPINLMLSLESHKELLLYRHPEQARNGNKEAIRICVDAIQSCFGVVQFTEPALPGLTITEMLNLLDAFMCYCELQKKSTSRLETSLQSMEPMPNESTEPTTHSSLDSGSIVTAQ